MASIHERVGPRGVAYRVHWRDAEDRQHAATFHFRADAEVFARRVAQKKRPIVRNTANARLERLGIYIGKRYAEGN